MAEDDNNLDPNRDQDVSEQSVTTEPASSSGPISNGTNDPQPEPVQSSTVVRHGLGAGALVGAVIALLIIAAVAYLVYNWEQSKITTLQTKNTGLQSQVDGLKKQVAKIDQTNKADGSSTKGQSSAPAKTVKDFSAASLFQKCQSDNVNATGLWQESTPTVKYVDFNGDGVLDVLVYDTFVGTAGTTQGCVYTVKNDDLSQLWRLDNTFQHSTLTLNAKNQIIYTGYPQGSDSPSTVTYVWSTSQDTFLAQ